MKVGIAGSRGSIPTPTGTKLFGGRTATEKYGGNTTCIYLQGDDGSEHIIDAGSGIRSLGLYLLSNQGFDGQNGKTLNLYITHTHWDHVQGLPFFVPGYVKGNRISVFGEAKVNGIKGVSAVKSDLEEAIAKHSDQPGNCLVDMVFTVEGEGIKKVLEAQQRFRNFPAPLEALSGIKEYHDFVAGSIIYESPTMRVETMGVNHPGGCVSYKFTERKKDGSERMFVFSTDFEPDSNGHDDKMIKFWECADLVIADAQYEPLGSDVKDNPFMQGWGHSDYKSDILMATIAKAKRLVGTHHEPKMNDSYHDGLEERAKMESERVADELKGERVDFELAKEGVIYTI